MSYSVIYESGCHSFKTNHGTWKKGNFSIKSGKTLKSQGEKIEKA